MKKMFQNHSLTTLKELTITQDETYLNVAYNLLIKIDIPLNTFSNITDFRCFHNGLTSLYPLPPNLKTLTCFENNLASLPELPVTLKELQCSHNKLTSLPEFPVSLEKLWCQQNKLTCIPKLPDKLTLLNCGYNKLVILPELPATLNMLICDNNNIAHFPTLPKKLYTFHCMSNKIITLPDLPWECEDLMMWGNDCQNDYYIRETDSYFNVEDIKLGQHNRKRLCLELPPLDDFPEDEEWYAIEDQYTCWLYRPGGDKYYECERVVENLVKENKI